MWVPLALIAALAVACEDSSAGGEAGAGGASGGRDAAIDNTGGQPGPGLGPLDAAAMGGDDDPTPLADSGTPWSGDAAVGPAGPECEDDDACGPARVCQNNRCIEGTRCETPDACSDGFLCVGGLCLPDPLSTGGLAASPDTLLFTFSEVDGSDVLRDVTISNQGDAAVEITGIRIEGSATFFLADPAPMPPVRLVPGQETGIVVAFRADDQRIEEAVLRFTSDAGAPLEVRLVSQFKPLGSDDPCLQIVPNRIQFGGVLRGQEGRETFRLISCGAAPLTINAIRRGAGPFGVGQLPDTFQLGNPPAFPMVLMPGGSQDIEVVYRPLRAGLESGHWVVDSTDPANPQQRVDVVARAQPPAIADIGLHIRMNWDTDLNDVDLHLLGPNGQMWDCDTDCFFGNPAPDFGVIGDFIDDPFLDVDDVDGFGPENINIEQPQPGTYTVLVHYYADHEYSGPGPNVTVEVLNFGMPIASFGPERVRNVDDVWSVATLEWPGPVIRPIGGIMRDPGGGGICGGIFP
jgi:hypothetical protein